MEKLRTEILRLYKAKTGKAICVAHLDEITADVLAWLLTPSVLQQAVIQSPLWLSLTGDDARRV
ncbi:MAG TPA: hypothetical protein PKB02_02465 [Anaerohalosphaeraceae bacterium]|nr:hypothetical protein [Anaerohalosphaeraceae bacterium]